MDLSYKEGSFSKNLFQDFKLDILAISNFGMPIPMQHFLCQIEHTERSTIWAINHIHKVKCAGSLERPVAYRQVVKGISPQPSVESTDLQ